MSATPAIVAVGATSAALILARTARDAAFLDQASGIENLPWAYVTTQVGLTLGAIIHVQVMKRQGTRRTRVLVFSLMGVLALLVAPFVGAEHPTVLAVLFPGVSAAFAALFASAWLLGGDLLQGQPEADVRRGYVRIGAAGMMGGILGGLFAAALGSFSGPRVLLAAAGVILSGVAALAHLTHRNLPRSGVIVQPPSGSQKGVEQNLWQQPRVRLLALVASLGTVVGLLVEFQFYAVAARDGHANVAYFSRWYLFAGVFAIAIQLSATSWFLNRFGPGRALSVLPVAMLGGAAVATLFRVGQIAAVLRLSESTLRMTFHQTSWEQTFLAFNQELRGRIKVLIDGVLSRVVGGAAALLLVLVLRVGGTAAVHSLTWLAAALFVGSAAWLVASRGLGKKSTDEPAELRIPLPDQ